MRLRQVIAIGLLLSCSVAWLDTPRSKVAEANRLYKAGKYSEALQHYGEAVVDNPDSPLLNYNMGNAQYKVGKYSEALTSFSRVNPSEKDKQQLARVAYNAGNVQYRLAVTQEGDKPQEALKSYAQALVAYRRALGADAGDQDAKFNYEMTLKRIADLKKKIEEQQKQQEKDKEKQEQQKDQQKDQEQNQQQQQQDQQQDQQQPQQDGQQGGGGGESPPRSEDGEKKPQPQPQPEQQQADQAEEQPQPESGSANGEQPEDSEGGAGTGAAKQGEPQDRTRQEAAALLDSAKSEELSPQEFTRRQQGAAVAEPAQDW